MSLNTDKLNGVDFTPTPRTPRTDRAWAQGYDSDYAVNGINKDFAEKLERELNEMADLMTHRMNQRDEAEKEVSELIEALRKTIVWAECCRLDRSQYPNGINWNYLNEGRKALLKSKFIIHLLKL